ncbi:hypothetical protein [Salinirubrum litoreum]|uniref:Uncharacterized protein n=1 Tax=Salinirubrum litoreum TaxID=1126234 RepID=A0ABD5REJ5_9EURY|nr:hypothetical protein [Salinirubrum litoreum]
MTLRTTLGRTVATVAVVTLTLTLLAGVLGALWRVTFWGAMGGHPMYGGYGPMHGAGYANSTFQLGFGVPLGGVLAWAFLLSSVAALGYLGYRLVEATDRERAGPGDTA